MTYKNTLVGMISLVVVGCAGYYGFSNLVFTSDSLDPNPKNTILSGTYVCLPHLDTTDLQTEECMLGLKTDDGVYYAVNFGQSQNAMDLFQNGAHITAEGFVVIKEALSTDQWVKYNMKGIFTITKMIDPAPAQGKLDINAVCEGALAYMTFPNASAAELFVSECKEGKHPEVIENYKAQMDLGDGVAI